MLGHYKKADINFLASSEMNSIFKQIQYWLYDM